ncbi:MAG: hypothetical protein PHV68_01580 [Candidatus Gastranaerophilales bacterium]|nr:hypothetical protein [Candidatus Gastranaerophilales bacterium]
MKIFFKLLLIVFISVFSFLPAIAEVDYVPLMKNYEQGERLFKAEKAKLDKKVKEIYADKTASLAEMDAKFEEELKKFYEKSRQLTAKYREPVVKAIQNDVNAGLPKNKKMLQSAGTDLYITNANGQKILNSKHRGWSGDFDFGASSHATQRLETVIKKIDTQMREAKIKEIEMLKAKGYTDKQITKIVGNKYNLTATDSFPGYTNVNRFEMTVNKGGNGIDPIYDQKYKLGDVGSSAHQTQIEVDAHSKETYVSIGMEKNQPGRQAVEISDHHKKAVKGLKKDPKKLMGEDNIDDLQGMVKGTLKSVKSKTGNTQADLVGDIEVEQILKANGIDSKGADFKNKLEYVKSTPEMTEVIFRDIPPEKLQKACGDLIDVAHTKADIIAQNELELNKKQIAELESQAKDFEAKGDKRKADDLRKEANSKRAQQIDSETRIKETRNSVNSKKGNQTDILDINRPKTQNITNIDLPASKTTFNINNLTKTGFKTGLKAGGAYLFLLDMKGNIEDFNDTINKVLDEEKAGDSEYYTVAKATGIMLMKMSGIPAMAEALVQSREQAEVKLKEDIAKDPNLTMKDFDRLIASYRLEADLNLAGQMAMGIAEEAISLPGNTGKWLGELSAKDDLDKAIEMNTKQEHELKMFKYRHDKLVELQATMYDLIENGYDDNKVAKKNELVNYFYDLNVKSEIGSDLEVMTSRWIEKIDLAQKDYKEAMALRLKLHDEKMKEKQKLFEWDDDLDQQADNFDDKKTVANEPKIFVPDTNEVNIVLNTAASKTSNAYSSWSQGVSSAHSSTVDHNRQMAQINSQAQAEQKRILSQHQKAMNEIKSTNIKSNPSFDGIENASKSNTPIMTSSASKTEYKNEEQKEAQMQEQIAKEKQLESQLRDILNSKKIAKENLQQCNAQMQQQERNAYKSCHDRMIAEKGSWMAIGNAERGACKAESHKAIGHLGKTIYVDEYYTEYTCYTKCKTYIDLIKNLNKDIERYDKEYGLRRSGNDFVWRVK